MSTNFLRKWSIGLAFLAGALIVCWVLAELIPFPAPMFQKFLVVSSGVSGLLAFLCGFLSVDGEREEV